MRAFLLAAVLTVAAFPVMAKKLTIERIYDGGSLSGATVRGLKVSPDGKRVTFLRAKADDQHTFDLWEYNLADQRMHMLVDSRTLGGDQHLSDAEKARRERERTAGLHGILDYQWSPDGSKLLIPVAGTLYLYDLSAPADKAVTKLDTGGDAIDPKISPKGHYVSYVRDQNLWVIDLANGQSTQLTQDGGGTVHNGEAEFVAQEEMARSTGYWWAPDDSSIAYERYDAAPVPVTQRMEIYADHTAMVDQRYPFAGDPNVTVKLGLVSPKGGATRWIDLGDDPDSYLTRVNWLPDATQLSYQWMPRSQQKLELRLVDTATLKQRVLLTETSRTWIDLNDDLRFLPDGQSFIWGSDRSGYHHLYLYGLDGTLKHPISAGDWNLDGLLAVDEKKGLVYVSSNRDFVPDRQVYALKLDGSDADAPQRITQRDGTHQVKFAPDGSFYVDTFSDPNTPPQVSVHRADGSFVTWIEENKLDENHPYWPYMDSHVTPEYGHIKALDGQDLYYRVYKPLNFDPNKKYPVFDTFYGGPHAQEVTRGWVDYFAEYMAQQGFVVFTLDNRGMARRGRKFSDAIYHQLGVAEVEDQIAGIDWLKQQPWVDAKRIGVFGWSYGGYMTLMMLAKDSADLAGGVAVAPVTDWTLYDTFYTERYLGRPQDNEAGYTRSSPMAWLDGLTAPLMLVHGMADDNVLFLNSTKLMSALQQRGIQFGLMTYPGGKHGLNLPGQRAHVYHLIDDFFERTVKDRDPAAAPEPTAAEVDAGAE
ncbi:S9 family peptidase [Oleiagrimonas sp. MCCC 1A03011]|uniref:S9 family peptidase n=1 Tax=Oleiagrimonas sp. MCCC 1A03011 TaxID=1926883 RepID=UPI000DC4792E|nr:S9 family peptidase [Oleiagrimonas sp. MCCC 1A03011]RAP57136.1 S9 family peptidase [Oleiagrimonas sp. MCCC 1A03011]